MYQTFIAPIEEQMGRTATKIQARGVLTLPLSVRRDLGAQKGDTVDFIKNEQGETVIKLLSSSKIKDVFQAFDELGAIFKEQGTTMEQFIEGARKARKHTVKKSLSNK